MSINKYQNSKIYKIVCNITNEIYVGSTYQQLEDRLRGHVHDAKCNTGISSKQIINRGDFKIELVEYFPCESRKELHLREGFFHLQFQCVNKYVAGRSHAEWCKTEKGKVCCKERNDTHRQTDKWKITEEKYEKKRRESMTCQICFSSFQKRNWYVHITGAVHLGKEKETKTKYCKCGSCLDPSDTNCDHEQSEHHQSWIRGGIKAIETNQ